MKLFKAESKNLPLFFAHQLLYKIHFFGVVAFAFFVSKEYSTAQALHLLALTVGSKVILEVPTGVVGDKFGHRKSLIAGASLVGLSMLATIVTGENILLDALCMVLLGAGESLVSGSDTGVLKAVSKNFDSSDRTFSYLKTLVVAVTSVIAGFVGEYSLSLAVGLGSGAAMVSIVPLVLMNVQEATKTESAVSTAMHSLRVISQMKHGVVLLMLVAAMGGLAVSSKEIASSFNETLEIDLALIGFITAGTLLARTLGVYIEKYLNPNLGRSLLILSGFLLVTGLIAQNRAVGITSYLVAVTLGEALYYRARHGLAKFSPQNTIASVLSLGGLARSIVITGLIAFAGLMSDPTSRFPFLFLVIGLVTLVFAMLSRKIQLTGSR